jgi:predicted O-methyltransferase YrrM
MRIVAHMLSCPAREAVRNQTLANLAATDWGHPVFVEIDQTSHARLQERQTETALRLLQRAATQESDFVLFIEDDLDFNRFLRHNLQNWFPMRQAAPGGHFFGSLYNPHVKPLESEADLAFFIADPSHVYGSQAFILSMATLRHIVNGWESQIGMQDIKMSRLAAAVTQICYHQPSLVEHVGVVSAWGGRYHQAVDFQRDWKAEESSERASPSLIIPEMRKIDGWLDDAEARLLIDTVVEIASARRACRIVEVGSYCGKSTVLFALTLKQLGLTGSRISAVDCHDGRISTLDGRIVSTGETFDKFSRNIASAGVAAFVETIVARSADVSSWDEPIDLLFIDGLHDYDHVAADFERFSSWIRPGGFVAFHDCAAHFIGVQRFVGDLIGRGAFQVSARVKSLVVLTRTSSSAPA